MSYTALTEHWHLCDIWQLGGSVQFGLRHPWSLP